MTKHLIALFLFFSTCLYAMQQNGQMPPRGSGGSLGTVYDTKIEGVSPYMQIFDRNVTIGFGMNSDKSKVSLEEFEDSKILPEIMKKRYINFIGHMGVRGMVLPNLYASFGASGAYMWDREESAANQFAFGPFVGCDIPFLQVLMISAQITRPLYAKESALVERSRRLKNWGGLLGLSYTF